MQNECAQGECSGVRRAPRSAGEQLRASGCRLNVAQAHTFPLCHVVRVSQSLTQMKSSTEMASMLGADASMALHTRMQYCLI